MFHCGTGAEPGQEQAGGRSSNNTNKGTRPLHTEELDLGKWTREVRVGLRSVGTTESICKVLVGLEASSGDTLLNDSGF